MEFTGSKSIITPFTPLRQDHVLGLGIRLIKHVRFWLRIFTPS